MTARDSATIGQRIAARRSQLNLTQLDLAGLTGLSEFQVNRAETGARRITAGELGAIADALGVSAAVLLGQTHGSRQLAVAARLANADVEPSVAPARDRARQLLETAALLERLLSTPRPTAPALRVPTAAARWQQGRDLAADVRRQLGLGAEPIADLSGLVEEHFPVLVDRRPLGTAINGLCIADHQGAAERSSVILVNSHDREGRQRFTLAHELCHLLCADGETLFVDYRKQEGRKDPRESRADAFAAYLLTPDAAVAALTPGIAGEPAMAAGPGSATVGQVRALVELTTTYGTSRESAVWRLFNVNNLVDERARDWLLGQDLWTLYKIAGRQDAYPLLQAQEDAADPPASLLTSALYAYSQSMIGLSPLLDLLGRTDASALQAELKAEGWAPQLEPVSV